MFPMTLTLTAANQAELDKITTLLGYSTLAARPADPKPQPAAAKATAAATAPAAAAPETKVENSDAQPASSDAGKTYTIDDAKSMTTALVKKIGTEETRKLLGKYNAPVAAKLNADQITPFCLDAEKALAS